IVEARRSLARTLQKSVQTDSSLLTKCRRLVVADVKGIRTGARRSRYTLRLVRKLHARSKMRITIAVRYAHRASASESAGMNSLFNTNSFKYAAISSSDS